MPSERDYFKVLDHYLEIGAVDGENSYHNNIANVAIY